MYSLRIDKLIKNEVNAQMKFFPLKNLVVLIGDFWIYDYHSFEIYQCVLMES